MASTDMPRVSYVFKPHNHHGTSKRDHVAIEQVMNQPPQKNIACQRCRKLRKKCSKHLPQCVTCLRMGHDCVYADDDSTGPKSQSSQRTRRPSAKENTSPPISSAPAPVLPPLKSGWAFSGNYTHRSSEAAQSVSAVHSLPPPQPPRLPSIKLPSINASQLTGIPLEHRPLPTRKHPLSGPTEIQSALLSTIISLGKENLQPSSNSGSSPLMVSREVAEKCLQSYFSQCDHLYPFINKRQFLSKWESLNLFKTLNPTSTASEREKKCCFQTYLMLSIGFHSLIRTTGKLTEEEVNTHLHVFGPESVGDWLRQGTLSLRSYEDIVCMALLVIDSFYQRNCLATTNLTNILTGLILRYHYHRKLGPVEIQKVYKGDDWSLELRHRSFWTVYILDRTIATYLNKPIALLDSMITTPLPQNTANDTQDFAQTFSTLIDLKKIEGDIFLSIHSVTAINNLSAATNDETILQPLRKRVEQWYLDTTALSKNLTSDPLWLTTMYYNALTLIYRPSYCVPKPTNELHARLSRAVTQNLTYTYNLTTNHGAEHWLEMFRVLIVFKTLLRCFGEGSLNVAESRTELSLCVEITKSYRGVEKKGDDEWAFLDEIALVFQRLLKLVFEEARNEELINEAKYAEDRLGLILVEHAVGCRLDDRIEEEYGI